MNSLFSRRSLARVLTSLLRSELKEESFGAKTHRGLLETVDEWPEDLQLAGNEPSGLGCDSLDLLRLAAAVNEMFHLYEAEQELDLLSAKTFGEWLDSIETAWASGVAHITFMTSGSTGRPKRCTHAFSNLQTEVTYLASVFADRTRIIPLTPAHHIYGFLFTAMLPEALGHPPELPTMESRAHVPKGLRRGDLIVTFPERWHWLYRTVTQWPNGISGVVSTAPCPPDLICGLIERGLESLTEVYGSSETAGIGLRRWPETRYSFMPHWTTCESGDSEGALLTHSSGLQIRLKDHLEIHEDGSFTLAGRVDDAVQVGGINVYPARIATSIQQQPGVLEARVRLCTYPGGNRLKAFVVPQPELHLEELRAQLEDWANGTLKAVERPKSIVFGSSLPKDKMGKDCDW